MMGPFPSSLPTSGTAFAAALSSATQKETSMPTIVAHHKVKDQQHWLASPKRKEFFGLIGVTNIRTFINPTDPTSVALMMDVPDMEKFGAAMQSKGAADAMAYDGVLPETVVVCLANAARDRCRA
jgi:hypothetical protein